MSFKVIHLFESFRTWLYIIKAQTKIGKSVKELIKETRDFYRSNIIRVLGATGEGWFKFLESPKTLEEIAGKFQYTDLDFLKEVLDTLVADTTLETNQSKYTVKGPVKENRVVPKIFNTAVVEVLESYAQFLPERLRGKYNDFSGGFQLYNWDETLGLQLYEWIRKSAFIFSGALNRSGKFLDIGCGNGIGTVAIWNYFHEKNKFYPGTDMEIVGLDPNDQLLVIARDEFATQLKKLYHYRDEQIDLFRAHFPRTFIKGSVTSIPYEDSTFDMVYASQVLHWTKPQVALKEMIRVAKPGGLIFGTQVVTSTAANKFMNLHIKTVKGAEGFFSRANFTSWALEAGAKKLAMATPIMCFKFTK